MRRLWRDQRGGAAIEFAIVAPVLFTIVFGGIDMGRMLYADQSLQNATQKAARYYSLNSSYSTSSVTQYLQSQVAGGMGAQVSVSYASTSSCNSNANVTCTTITATYPFTFAASYLGFGSKTIRAVSQAILN